MSNISRAIRDLMTVDELAMGSSYIHSLHPLAKLSVTIAYIIIVMSCPMNGLSGLVPFILYPVIMLSITGQTLGECLYRFRFILPLLIMVGIWNPILDRQPVVSLGAIVITNGFITFITLILKGLLALSASYVLVTTTSIEKVCYAFRIIGVPKLIVTQLLISYRYINLFLREARTMLNAYHMRAPGQKGVHYKAWGSFIGQLILRCIDRAEVLYQSMVLRGFHDDFYYANVEKAGIKDYIFAVALICIFILCRCFNISVMIGNLFI